MPTQAQIAVHLGISQPAVCQIMQRMGIDWEQMNMDQIRLAYCARLREEAAGRTGGSSKNDLIAAKIRKTTAEARNVELTFLEREKKLIDLTKISPLLCAVMRGVKEEFIRGMHNFASEYDLTHKETIDRELLDEHIDKALTGASRYVSSPDNFVKELESGASTTPEDGNNAVGREVQISKP